MLHNVKRNKIILIVLVFVMLLSFSRLLDYPPGEESYSTLNTATEFLKSPSPIIRNELSFSSRVIPQFSFIEILLAIASYFTALSILAIAKILSLLASIMILFLFFRILTKLKIENKIRFLSMAFLVISPIFIYLMSSTSRNLFPTLLAVLAFYFYIKSSYKSLSFVLFLLALVNPFAVLVILAIFIPLLVSKAKKYFKIIFPSLLVLFFYLIYLIYFFRSSIYINIFQELSPTYLIFSDFNFNPGISIFLLIAAVYGLLSFWKKIPHSRQLFFTVFFLLFLSFFSQFALFLLVPILSVLAAFGIYELHNRKWASSNLKVITISALMFGIVLSSLTFLFNMETQLPSKEIVLSLNYLKFNSPTDAVILSDSSRGQWINYFAERKNVADSNAFLAPYAKQRLKDIDAIFKTRDIGEFNKIINRYNITYVFLDNELKNKLWKTKGEGMQFILENDQNIVRVYKNSEVEIWKILR